MEKPFKERPKFAFILLDVVLAVGLPRCALAPVSACFVDAIVSARQILATLPPTPCPPSAPTSWHGRVLAVQERVVVLGKAAATNLVLQLSQPRVLASFELLSESKLSLDKANTI